MTARRRRRHASPRMLRWYVSKSSIRRRLGARRTDALMAVVLDFQFIEAALKRYLEYAYRIVELLTWGTQPFKQSRADVEDLALRGLVTRFARFTDDVSLVRDLQGLQRDRDHCAHRAFMEAFVKTGRGKAADDFRRLQSIRKRTQAAFYRLMLHVAKQRTIHGIDYLTHRIKRGDFNKPDSPTKPPA